MYLTVPRVRIPLLPPLITNPPKGGFFVNLEKHSNPKKKGARVKRSVTTSESTTTARRVSAFVRIVPLLPPKYFVFLRSTLFYI